MPRAGSSTKLGEPPTAAAFATRIGAARIDPADFLSGILEVSLETIIVTDDHLTILAASVGAERLFGFVVDEMVGASVEMLIPERFRAGHAAFVEAFRKSARGSLKMDGRGETFATRKDESEVPVEVTLYKHVHGRRTFFTIILRDVTERQQAEARLRASEQRLAIAIESADLHVFELDFETRRLFKAGAEDTFFEKPRTFEDMAEDPFRMIHPKDRDAVRWAWGRHRVTGEAFRVECRMHRNDGEDVWAMVTAELFEDAAGRPLRLIGALQNVSARVRARADLEQTAAAAEAASIAKTTFLTTMSHEIRTPMNGVLGMIQAMGQDELSPAQRERLGVIRDSGEALMTILNDVLDLSKIEAGRLELETVDFDPTDLVRGVLAALAPTAQAKGVSLGADIEAAGGIYCGDPARLRQILYNLVSNAVKFTGQGRITVSAARMADGLRLTVSDTGIGMTAAQQAMIFQPFSQADASTTRRFGGTGLGLAICSELAELMGGSIAVESQLGRGSRFVVEVPLAYVEPAIARREEPPPAAEPTLRSQRVLAADDHATNQLVLRTLLAQVGVDVVVVGDGQAAVEAWEASPFDLILMDINMPVMDGLQATREIRRREADRGQQRTPILALTANALTHQVEEYLVAGMDDCVTKPIDARRLLAAMEAVTAEAGIDQELAS